MRADVVIIGGGLSALTAGITLCKAGRRVIIVSAGQSCVQFSSGSLELLGDVDGKVVENPLRMVERLNGSHPYKRIGEKLVRRYATEVIGMLKDCGISVQGGAERNHWRITPIGEFKPAWLSFGDYAAIENPEDLSWRKVALLNFKGYIDFYPSFLARSLGARGIECLIDEFTISAMDNLRKSASEMRATTMARVLVGGAIEELADVVNEKMGDADVVLMPAVVGLYDEKPLKRLRELVRRPLYMVPTMPASVPGVRAQMCMRDYFESMGGVYLLGDTVVYGAFTQNRLDYILTANLGDTRLEGEDYILATGSFFSNGLEALPDRIRETVFGLDTNATERRSDWFAADLFQPQPYMTYGVATDEKFHPMLKGEVIENMYASGAVLGGYNPMREGSGGGVAVTTAMAVANEILKGKEGRV